MQVSSLLTAYRFDAHQRDCHEYKGDGDDDNSLDHTHLGESFPGLQVIGIGDIEPLLPVVEEAAHHLDKQPANRENKHDAADFLERGKGGFVLFQERAEKMQQYRENNPDAGYPE